jgi:hypothetical protein
VTDIQIQAQYSTGASRQAIEQALVAAGKDLGHLRPEDLALLEDFHTMGRIATAQLADLAGITPDDEVLDAGCGGTRCGKPIAGCTRHATTSGRCELRCMAPCTHGTVCDRCSTTTPEPAAGIESTLADLDAADLRRARASTGILAAVRASAARRHPVDLPAAMAAYVTRALSREP